MSGQKPRFELEDDDERPARKPRAGLPPAEHFEPSEADDASDASDASDVDVRTVRERAGTERARGDEVVPPPEDWPREALNYPLRGKGPALIASTAAALVILDVLGTSAFARFPAWILKLIVVVFLLRGQLRLIGSSAAGDDEPGGWERALEFSSEDMKRWAVFMGLFLFALVPGWALILFDAVQPGLLVLGIGSMYVSVVALGSALGDPRLKRPWRAVAWMLRKPLPCVVGSLGWWILGLSEFAVSRSLDSSVALVVFLSVVLRIVDIFALMLSARALGVLGRSWQP